MKEKNRNSNIELLRIVSMILIILHHFTWYSDINTINIKIDILKNILVSGSQIAINCFILITGYFLINSEFKIKKLLKIVLETVFYSIIIFVIFCIFDAHNFSWDRLQMNFLPITHKLYWFFTNYIILYCLFPFINIMLKQLSKKQFKILLFVLIGIFSIIPTIISSSSIYSELAWFITVYCIGAYIRLNGNKYFKNLKLNLCIFIIGYVIVISSIILFSIYKIMPIQRFGQLNKLPIVIISINLFLIFLNIKVMNNKIINTISQCTFGVYLIHEHYLMREFLWKYLFNASRITSSLKLIMYAVAVTFIVYIVCTMIDVIRENLIEEPVFKLIDKIEIKNKKLQ